jgi:hypothetical protein
VKMSHAGMAGRKTSVVDTVIGMDLKQEGGVSHFKI